MSPSLHGHKIIMENLLLSSLTWKQTGGFRTEPCLNLFDDRKPLGRIEMCLMNDIVPKTFVLHLSLPSLFPLVPRISVPSAQVTLICFDSSQSKQARKELVQVGSLSTIRFPFVSSHLNLPLRDHRSIVSSLNSCVKVSLLSHLISLVHLRRRLHGTFLAFTAL
jgi:hypothetical protein